MSLQVIAFTLPIIIKFFLWLIRVATYSLKSENGGFVTTISASSSNLIHSGLLKSPFCTSSVRTPTSKSSSFPRILHAKNRHKTSYSKNTKDASWDFEQFCTIKCRIVKFEIAPNEYEVLVTNLNRFEFPIDEMKALYHLRWDIETSFRELKYALGGMNFHSKKDDFIEMEIFAHLVMFNAVSRNTDKS